MGISVEKPMLKQLLQAAVDAYIHQLIRVDPHGFDGIEAGELDPLDPFHGQHPAAGEFPVNLRDSDAVVMAMQFREALGIRGFIEVIHLLKHPAPELIDQRHQIAADQADVGFEPGGDVSDDVEVERDLLSQSRALHLHRHSATIFECAAVHLTQ